MEKKLIRAPYIDQTKEWPTGCESVSAVMLLRYLGIDITVERFAGEFLEKKAFAEKGGKVYGGNPWEVFAGDPADEKSMGCYAPVIVKALDKVFSEGGTAKKSRWRHISDEAESGVKLKKGELQGVREHSWDAVDLTGVSMKKLQEEYLDKDMPVIFWASLDLKETLIGPEWILEDTGEIFTWRSNEHCMLLVGYDGEKYYFNDPWHDHGTIGYERNLVEKRHGEQYEMAVSVKKG